MAARTRPRAATTEKELPSTLRLRDWLPEAEDSRRKLTMPTTRDEEGWLPEAEVPPAVHNHRTKKLAEKKLPPQDPVTAKEAKELHLWLLAGS